MKKVAQLLFIFSLLTVLISCTPKDSDNSASGVVLLKKLTSDVMGNHVVYNFNYKGTQLTKVTFDSYTPNHTNRCILSFSVRSFHAPECRVLSRHLIVLLTTYATVIGPTPVWYGMV